MQLRQTALPFQKAHRVSQTVPTVRQHTRLVRVRASEQPGTTTRATSPEPDQVPIGCSRYTVQLRKPLGIVLEQDASSLNITVAEVKPGSNAERAGVSLGDQLIATSGVTYARIDDYAGAKVQGGQEVIRMRVIGETMKTVSAAIGSHPGHIPVTLEFQKCERPL